MFKKIKDPISALTHLVFAVLSIPCTVFLLIKAYSEASALHFAAFLIFGIALLLLYTASTLYHMLPISEKNTLILKRIDHMMIFVLIAGTYTPVCLIPLKGAWGYSLLGLVWGFAIAGIVLKAVWIGAPRWLSTLIYVVMGWLVLIAFYPLTKNVSLAGIILLALGGLTYTFGAVVYAIKWPKLNFKFFGFHEIFHIFVMGGSTFHIIFMFLLT